MKGMRKENKVRKWKGRKFKENRKGNERKDERNRNQERNK